MIGKRKRNMYQVIKYVNGVALKRKVEVSNRWKKYFEGLLNVRDDRKMEVNCR